MTDRDLYAKLRKAEKDAKRFQWMKDHPDEAPIYDEDWVVKYVNKGAGAEAGVCDAVFSLLDEAVDFMMEHVVEITLKVQPSRLHEVDQPGVLRIDDGVVSEFKPLRVAPPEIAPALESLRDHQDRVDEEGVDCVVSRQAVFEVLRFYGMI